ncbi:MAG: LON peptidase substrate-binding domain-containing protein [Armatimonadetes bacterium]|nr:LON peptidase substrate-binding domain-containing protein [Armatimonadota bacterium]
MGLLEDLPIMPLKNVLFPGAPTSLYIHEERYRKMLDECVENEAGIFGVALLRAGQEVGGTGIPHDTGTIARIAAVTKLPDRSSLVMARGGPRFRIRRIMQLRPVVTAEVEVLTDSDEIVPADESIILEARERLRTLLDLVAGDIGSGEVEIEIPEEPVLLSWAVAAHVPAPLEMQQQLLEAPSVARRLELALPLLREEVNHYQVIAAARKRMEELGIPEDEGPFSRS